MIHSFFIAHSYLIGLVSFLLGLITMPVVIQMAKTKGFVVRPNKRMSHTGEVPNIGGLNIIFSFMLTYLLLSITNSTRASSSSSDSSLSCRSVLSTTY